MILTEVSEAVYEAGWLKLKVPASDAMKFIYKFVKGEYELIKSKKKRGLTANAYCWVLCTAISKAVGISKEDIYRRAISEGNQYASFNILPEALEDFNRVWSAQGMGWVTKVIDKAPGGFLMVFAYYGSSAYDTKQMSELIDNLVQDAKALEIETLSERELSLLKENWGNEKSN